MAEGVLFNVAGGIIERLGSLAFREIGLIWGVQDEFQKLKETVARFQAILLDAEQKQANDEVKLWLQSVEDAVYEADDVLDEFNTKNQRRTMVPENTKLLKKVGLFFSSSNQLVFGLKMGHKIKNINKKLSAVENHKTFHFEVNHEDTPFVNRERVNHSFVRKENIIGREKDKTAIIQLLLDSISTKNVSTISIVGIGGLGKTALAKLIFNEEMIQKHFELKIWTCVSNVFELDIVVKKILQSEHNGIEQLQNDLRKKVDGKKYLLVLDDVWNEDKKKWLDLENLLMGGGEGSRILITTRSKKVATIPDFAKPYTLKGLNEEQSWSLFKTMAYQDGKEPENSTIKAIGKEVTRKCQGVPLAIKTIGGMSFAKDDETYWLNFKEKKLSKINQEENDILPTLKLSYDVLPSHLKHCFAYCSLFPPDYEISVQRLIRFWVAQGFIESSDENECLEDVAYEYYRELLQRSFFQEEKINEFGKIVSCKMHDLMNELAILVSGVGSVVVDLNQKNFHEKLRHLSFNFEIDLSKWEVPTSLLKASKIRTFLFLRRQSWNDHQSSSRNAFYTTIVSNFKSLRMLSLNKLGITTLPNCLRKMKHLRYLDLSGNPMKRLPDWIVGLSNLETLDLSDCQELVELPRDIKKMINLRHLILEKCWGLSGMPRGIGELNGVRTLNRFVLSESNCLGRGGSAGLAELGTLKELRGHLEIHKLRHVVSESNVGTPLKDKHHLCSLDLFWKYREDVRGVDEEDIIKSMEVLQPHSNLKQLSVEYYGGVRFASWFSSLINIVNLRLGGCKRCQHLPPLDHLLSLKSLHLWNLEKLEYISENESSNSMSDEMMRISSLPSLEYLYIAYCPVLKGWWRAHTHNSDDSSSSTENLSLPSFPRLSTLIIRDCPNLTSLPLYPNVEIIELTRSSWKVVDSLFVRGASDITHDVGVDVSASSSSPHPSKLTHLSLHAIEDLASLPEEISNLTSLQGLGITNCSNLSSLPEGIICLPLRSLYLTALEKLEYISENESSNSMSDEMMRISSFPSLEYLYIADCPVLKGWWRAHTHNSASSSSSTENLSLPSFTRLSTLQIYNCPNLSSMPLYPNVEIIELGRSSWKVVDSLFVRGASDITHDVGVDVSASSSSPHLSKLTYLKLEGIEDLASLPEEINNLTSLQHLQISNCSNLSSLPEGIICLPLRALTLTALEKLEYISENESSNSMSDEMMRISFFPSLEYLKLYGCPVLKGWWRAHTHNNAASSSSTENLSLPSFPRLSTLRIKDCPNLTSMPLYPNVVKIELENTSWKVVDSLFVRGASDITHDVGVDVSASSSSPHLSKLTHLSLHAIEDLASLPEEISNLTSLQELAISNCDNLASLPEGIHGLPCLNTLDIYGCPKIAHIPDIDID